MTNETMNQSQLTEDTVKQLHMAICSLQMVYVHLRQALFNTKIQQSDVYASTFSQDKRDDIDLQVGIIQQHMDDCMFLACAIKAQLNELPEGFSYDHPNIPEIIWPTNS